MPVARDIVGGGSAVGGGGDFGIRIPGGDPGTLHAAAGQLRGVAGTMERVAGALASAGHIGGWSGVASVAYANRCVSEQSAVDSGAGLVAEAARVFDDIADELAAAQREARQAVEAARQADQRQKAAEAAARDARADAASARQRADSADNRIHIAASLGRPSVAAHAERAEATHAAHRADQSAASADSKARGAAGDLASAQTTGRAATARYEEAARRAAARLDAITASIPVVQAPTGLPHAATGGPGGPDAVPPLLLRGAAPHGDRDDHGAPKLNPFLFAPAFAPGGARSPLGAAPATPSNPAPSGPPAPPAKKDGGGGILGGLKKAWNKVGDAAHTGLDVVGVVPGFGEPADLLNAGIYALEGNKTDALLSAGAAVPGVGTAAVAAKLGRRAARVLTTAGRLIRAQGLLHQQATLRLGNS